jgi:MoxR-like ATPase
MSSKKSIEQFDVSSLNHNELKREIRDSYNIKDSLFIWGAPGIGKSFIMAEQGEELAKVESRLYVDWNRSAKSLKRALLKDDFIYQVDASEHGLEGAVLLKPVSYTTGTGKAVTTVSLEAGTVLSKKAADRLRAAATKEPKGISMTVAGDFESFGTATGKSLCEESFVFADFRLSQCDPSDVKGLPFQNADGYMEWEPDIMFMVLSNPEIHGFLFFDELNQAVSTVQNAAYKLIHDRCCGDIEFSPGVMIVAAGNRMGDGGNSFAMAPALANRFTHYELSPPVIGTGSASDGYGWVDWAFDNEVDHRVISFLQWRPSFLMDDLNSVRKNRAVAWASPRTWDKASDKIKHLTGEDKGSLSQIHKKVASAVGNAKATEFQSFIKTTRKINMADILANPEQVKNFEVDMKWALISAVSEHYRSDKNKKCLDPILGMTKFLDPDFAVSMLRMMRKNDKVKFAARIVKCTNKAEVIKYKKFFQD